MVGDFQVGLGLWPRFGQQPDAAPEATLEQQAPEPVDAVANHADGARRTAPRVPMIGSQRFGRRPQIAWGDPAVLGIFHPDAVGQSQQGGHRQRQFEGFIPNFGIYIPLSGGADRGRYFRAMLMTLISNGARSMIFKLGNSALAPSQGPEEPVLDSRKSEGCIPKFSLYLPLSGGRGLTGGKRVARERANAELRAIRLAGDSLLVMALVLLVLLARWHIAPGGINDKSFIGGQAGTDCLYSGGFGFTFKVALLRRTSSLPASSVKVTFTLIFLPTTASVTV